MKTTKLACLTGAAVLAFAAAGAARADDTPPAAAAAAPAGPTALASPSMSASLSSNADPLNMDWGPLGKIYVSGQVSGFAASQTAPISGDRQRKVDISNLQIEVQKTDGVVQFYVQAGQYEFPSLGTGFPETSERLTQSTFKWVPVAYVKLQPTPEISILAGKLPTLIGAEYTFTFQNLNINRGLLWNQEPAISRGIQVNYAKGPLTISASVNDGYYSNDYSTISGLISYAVTPKDTVVAAASGNTKTTSRSSFVTPVAQNNGTIWNLLWTHTEDKWMINPYLQYSTTPKENTLGLPSSASTFGAAVLGKYAVTSTFNVAGRVEYISSSGSSVSLLYGPKSDAWSFTITPTLQIKQYFVRGEFAYVKVSGGANGAMFGAFGNKDEQSRAMIETGVLF